MTDALQQAHQCTSLCLNKRATCCEWDSATCSKAAGGGHLTILKWARANGCPWNDATCLQAAFRGHLDVLVWARRNGCEWHIQSCFRVARRTHQAVDPHAFIERKSYHYLFSAHICGRAHTHTCAHLCTRMSTHTKIYIQQTFT